MSNNKQCKVLMLPTEPKGWFEGILYKFTSNDINKPPILRLCTDFFCFPIQFFDKELVWQPQYLYFVSEDAISEGDWIYHELHPTPYKANIYEVHRDKALIPKVYKIVASTDLSLGLPMIPKLFLWQYEKAKGKVDEVRLEKVEHPMNKGTFAQNHYILKLTDNNEVIVVE